MANKNISKSENDTGSTYLSSLRDLEQKVEHMFQNMWHKPVRQDVFQGLSAYSPFDKLPRIDVIDRDKEVYVEAELPGFDKEDLDISIANNKLVIKAKSGER